ncbi:hypothetical protein BC628DRAFT_1412127 [Trametes gibbosa]|nr:hypothetical protein BC628DRAFT_1412127 [Trametes gibbosa]
MNSTSCRPRQPARTVWTLQRLVHKRAIALGHALDASTKLSYSSALNSYLNFIHIHAFPMESTANTLSLYATFMCHQIEPRSVDSYLSGICSELEAFYPAVRAARSSPLVSRTLKGFKRLRSKPVVRKRALASLGSAFDDSLFSTLLLTGFYVLLRLGELVWPDNNALQSYRKLTMRATVKVSTSTYEFLLPAHKADADPTSLAAAGVPPATIQALSRWSSDAWLVYIRKHPTLLSAMICDGRSLHDGAAT